MTTLALYSNKGGVGKTAAAVNLSYLASRMGTKTLICDLDPQGSATYYFRVKPKLKSGPKGFARGAKGVYKSVKGTDFENLDILPADFSLRKLDVLYSKFGNSKIQLKKMLCPFASEYRMIILDCPVTIAIGRCVGSSEEILGPTLSRNCTSQCSLLECETRKG